MACMYRGGGRGARRGTSRRDRGRAGGVDWQVVALVLALVACLALLRHMGCDERADRLHQMYPQQYPTAWQAAGREEAR